MTKIVTTPNAAASQTEHPWRATLRTLVQSVGGAALTVLGILIFVPGALDTLADALGELGIVVPAALIALPPVIARIMAIPGVEKALRSIGLGAAPDEHHLAPGEVYPELGESEALDLDAEIGTGEDPEPAVQVVETPDHVEVDATPAGDDYSARH